MRQQQQQPCNISRARYAQLYSFIANNSHLRCNPSTATSIAINEWDQLMKRVQSFFCSLSLSLCCCLIFLTVSISDTLFFFFFLIMRVHWEQFFFLYLLLLFVFSSWFFFFLSFSARGGGFCSTFWNVFFIVFLFCSTIRLLLSTFTWFFFHSFSFNNNCTLFPGCCRFFLHFAFQRKFLPHSLRCYFVILIVIMSSLLLLGNEQREKKSSERPKRHTYSRSPLTTMREKYWKIVFAFIGHCVA